MHVKVQMIQSNDAEMQVKLQNVYKKRCKVENVFDTYAEKSIMFNTDAKQDHSVPIACDLCNMQAELRHPL